MVLWNKIHPQMIFLKTFLWSINQSFKGLGYAPFRNFLLCSLSSLVKKGKWLMSNTRRNAVIPETFPPRSQPIAIHSLTLTGGCFNRGEEKVEWFRHMVLIGSLSWVVRGNKSHLFTIWTPAPKRPVRERKTSVKTQWPSFENNLPNVRIPMLPCTQTCCTPAPWLDGTEQSRLTDWKDLMTAAVVAHVHSFTPAFDGGIWPIIQQMAHWQDVDGGMRGKFHQVRLSGRHSRLLSAQLALRELLNIQALIWLNWNFSAPTLNTNILCHSALSKFCWQTNRWSQGNPLWKQTLQQLYVLGFRRDAVFLKELMNTHRPKELKIYLWMSKNVGMFEIWYWLLFFNLYLM